MDMEGEKCVLTNYSHVDQMSLELTFILDQEIISSNPKHPMLENMRANLGLGWTWASRLGPNTMKLIEDPLFNIREKLIF